MNVLRRDRVLAWIAVPVVAVTLYLGLTHLVKRVSGVAPPLALLDRPEDAARVGVLVAAAWRGEALPEASHPRLTGENYGVYLELRAQGQLSGTAWDLEEKPLATAIADAVGTARREAGAAVKEVDTALLCTAHTWSPIEIESADPVYGNVHRGVRGIEYRHGDEVRRYSPFEMIARNLSYEATLEQYLEATNRPRSELGDVEARVFTCEQIYVPLAHPEQTRLLMRGNIEIAPADVDEKRVAEATRLMGDWMVRSLQPDGRMTYKWWPSRGTESTANNMIRQWMASLALARVARARGDAAIGELAARNVRYNLAHFYREESGLGLIMEEDKVKLGAIALAALALMENPQRPEFAAQEKALIATTFKLQEADGAFQTMYAPPSPDRPFQNFYTGEALLLWAALYRENHDPALLERYMRSFRYYRDWHKKQRNPAFVPWHTQAHYIVWKETRDPELAEFIFSMNDWLLGMQEWDGSRYSDLRGRFYDENRKQFGPPHASSTGVYLEGLADALELARELKDPERARAYQQAIVRGLRSVLQLQFGDEIDMFYVTQRDRVLGGIRTEVYDNAIRVDNVQHNLLALLKMSGLFSSR